jgi:hypothetical protein
VKPQNIFVIALAIVCTVLPLAAQGFGDAKGGWLMVDFRAYYCAASAQSHHANPYFAAPLRACQSAPAPPFFRASKVTVPAPYPPYVLAALYPLTLLPFTTAAIVWWGILICCLIGAAYALARIVRQPFLVGWAVLVLSLGLTALSSGNAVIVGVASLVVCALCLQLGYLHAAALALVVAAIEPQLALPAAIAVFVRFPALRLVLLMLAALLAVGSLASAGLAGTLAYFTSVLPAHALSEVSRDNQYSLSTIVSAAGVGDARAVMLGGISYVIAAALGIVVGIRLAREHFDPAFAVFVPAAISLLGGSFVHTGEIAIAAPAALLLFVRGARQSGLALAIVVLLAVPWMMATSAAAFAAPFFPAAYLVYVLTAGNRTAALAAALATLVAIVGLFAVAAHPVPHSATHAVARPFIDPRLAEAGWRNFVLGNSTNRLAMWLLRLPTWIGLIGLLGCALAAVRTITLSPRNVQPARATT